jgi:phage terminase large subunit-like protein
MRWRATAVVALVLTPFRRLGTIVLLFAALEVGRV